MGRHHRRPRGRSALHLGYRAPSHGTNAWVSWWSLKSDLWSLLSFFIIFTLWFCNFGLWYLTPDMRCFMKLYVSSLKKRLFCRPLMGLLELILECAPLADRVTMVIRHYTRLVQAFVSFVTLWVLIFDLLSFSTKCGPISSSPSWNTPNSPESSRRWGIKIKDQILKTMFWIYNKINQSTFYVTKKSRTNCFLP